ncbi:tetratricopeptide repeat protein [Ruegeria sp. MALMAid1280]|uniref:tetratricopeptide repeat protein n=1 Tax=Ruegeria sp. MALMAid1280 TaxID=3411634 RepID=UPI003BA34C5E
MDRIESGNCAMDNSHIDTLSGLPKAEIEAVLGRILSSDQFVRSKRLCRFLTHIVTEALAGREKELGGYSIGLDVFDRPDNFDPSLDTIVRVEARRLRQALQTYYLENGANDAIRISMPTGSYVPVFETRDKDGNSLPPPKAGDVRRGPVIAVLPLDNFSQDSSEAFFANGLTEQLIASLARFRELSVISRHSVSRFQGENFDLQAMRDELGIDYFFEGSIRKTERNLRVTAQLIDAAEDSHLWAETFEQALTATELFDIQDDIAETMAARIADRYGSVGRVGSVGISSRTNSLDAYSAVLKFYDNYARHQTDTHAEARAALEKAIAVDPNYADAWAALAGIQLDEYRFGYNTVDAEKPALERATDSALHALNLDPESTMGYQFLACAHFHAGDMVAFRVTAERALMLNPGHADALADLGTCYWLIGDKDLGEKLVARAMELSPTHPGWYHVVPMCNALLAEDLNSALREAVLLFTPGFYWSYVFRASILARLGRMQDAKDDLEELENLYPGFGKHFEADVKKWHCSNELIEAIAAGLVLVGIKMN